MYNTYYPYETKEVLDESVPYFSCKYGKIFKNKLIIPSQIKKEIIINDIAFVELKHSRNVVLNYLAGAGAGLLLFLIFLLNDQQILIFPFVFLLGGFSLFYKGFDYRIQIIFRVPSSLYVNVEKKELKIAKQLVKKFNRYRVVCPKYNELL